MWRVARDLERLKGEWAAKGSRAEDWPRVGRAWGSMLIRVLETEDVV